jgi:hypothetical protein
MATAQDIMQVCETILARKAAQATSCKVNGVQFTALLYPDASNNGWCQRAVRLVYQAATGKSMPGAGCCAGQTCANLIAMGVPRYDGPWDTSKLLPGDFLYFGGGKRHETCGHNVGHAAIWLGNNRMFQHTSRGRLAITQQGPTASQRSRFIAAFRLLPQEAAEVAKPAGPTLVLPGGLVLTDGLSIVGGRLHAPVSVVAAALGAEIEWDAASKTATVRVDDPE